MLSSSDAKVVDVEMYDIRDMPVEDLEWAFTREEDFAYRGEFELSFSDEFMEYWEGQSDRWFGALEVLGQGTLSISGLMMM